jgi:triosephosphate isomerase
MYMAKGNRLIVFNWKENPKTSREASRLLGAVEKVALSSGNKGADVVVCPPFVYLSELSRTFKRGSARFSLGAQDVFWENAGPYTGEIGPEMLKQFGVRYVIIGHSERRRFLGETDEMVNKKVRAALAAGLRVVLCVGEPAEVRRKGILAARQYVKNQLKKDLQNLDSRLHGNDRIKVAYEPIWAIGTGKNDSAEDARDMANFIKKETRGAVVLYGGSTTGANVGSYLCYHEINGVLVGGASLRAEEIKKIIHHT